MAAVGADRRSGGARSSRVPASDDAAVLNVLFIAFIPVVILGLLAWGSSPTGRSRPRPPISARLPTVLHCRRPRQGAPGRRQPRRAGSSAASRARRVSPPRPVPSVRAAAPRARRPISVGGFGGAGAAVAVVRLDERRAPGGGHDVALPRLSRRVAGRNRGAATRCRRRAGTRCRRRAGTRCRRRAGTRCRRRAGTRCRRRAGTRACDAPASLDPRRRSDLAPRAICFTRHPRASGPTVTTHARTTCLTRHRSGVWAGLSRCAGPDRRRPADGAKRSKAATFTRAECR